VPELGFNRHPIPEMAALLAAYVEHRDLRGVRIVAHSKGGLIGKLLLVNDTAGRFDRLISINTPYLGSPLSRFGLGPWREFSPTRPVIVELGENLEVNAHITSLYSEFDQYVPEGKSVLPGAENVRLPHIGHFRVLAVSAVIDEIVARLQA
jgi:hypothetical protein